MLIDVGFATVDSNVALAKYGRKQWRRWTVKLFTE